MRDLKQIPKLHLIIIASLLFSLPATYATPIADGKTKFLGNVINYNIPGDFSDYWNQVTPENFGKWGNVEYIRNSMNWNPLKNAYDFAKHNGFPFKQHTFVWGQQEPSWISSLTKKEQREELEEFIRLFSEKFPNTDYADVVNEPINSPPSFREALGGSGSTGWDWVVWTFEKAKQYLPNTKLLINEFGIVNSAEATDKYIEIINILKERDLIDGIGIQSHCFNLQGTKPQIIKSNLDKLASTGLPVYSSELDLQGDDELQMRRFMLYFPIFWEHPGVKGVTLWGYKYRRTWIETTWLKDSNNINRPALNWLRSYVSTGEAGQIPAVKNGIISYIGSGLLIINSPKPALLEIYTINGRKSQSFVVNSNTQLSFESLNSADGVYILRVNRINSIRIVLGLDRTMNLIINK